MKFIERENEIIRILKKLSDFRIIVVGGYAVSARAKLRFYQSQQTLSLNTTYK